MTLLLDTHLLLWAFVGSKKLPKPAARLIDDKANVVAYSVVSLWEIAIKNSLGKPGFRVDVREFRKLLLENGYAEVPVNGEHVLTMTALPTLHKDPFDRMLVAQAVAEGFTLLTSDPAIGRYKGPAKLV